MSDEFNEPFDQFLVLWFWKGAPGGGVVDLFFEEGDAATCLNTLLAHGDPAKEFRMEGM